MIHEIFGHTYTKKVICSLSEIQISLILAFSADPESEARSCGLPPENSREVLWEEAAP